jgi:hypothetical protein
LATFIAANWQWLLSSAGAIALAYIWGVWTLFSKWYDGQISSLKAEIGNWKSKIELLDRQLSMQQDRYNNLQGERDAASAALAKLDRSIKLNEPHENVAANTASVVTSVTNLLQHQDQVVREVLITPEGGKISLTGYPPTITITKDAS